MSSYKLARSIAAICSDGTQRTAPASPSCGRSSRSRTTSLASWQVQTSLTPLCAMLNLHMQSRLGDPLAYMAPPSRTDAWLKATGTPFDALDACAVLVERAVSCPQCASVQHVRESHVHPSAEMLTRRCSVRRRGGSRVCAAVLSGVRGLPRGVPGDEAGARGAQVLGRPCARHGRGARRRGAG